MNNETLNVTVCTAGNGVNLLCISKPDETPLARHIFYTGSERDCIDWCDKRKHLVDIMKAWEQGKQIFFGGMHGYWYEASSEPNWAPDMNYKVKSTIDDIVEQSRCNISDRQSHKSCKYIEQSYDLTTIAWIAACVIIIVTGIVSSIFVVCNG